VFLWDTITLLKRIIFFSCFGSGPDILAGMTNAFTPEPDVVTKPQGSTALLLGGPRGTSYNHRYADPVNLGKRTMRWKSSIALFASCFAFHTPTFVSVLKLLG
jgi:hypothetical protein